MLLLGCKPAGRHTEQHDVFFGIGTELNALVPSIQAFWPEGKKNLHVDAWREVTRVGDYTIRVRQKTESAAVTSLTPVFGTQTGTAGAPEPKLFFINLGGYRKNEFEEYHHRMLVVAADRTAAAAQAKKAVFYKENGFKGASAHIDDTYGIDVDELYDVQEMLPPVFAAQYMLEITPALSGAQEEDAVQLGYLPLWKIK